MQGQAGEILSLHYVGVSKKNYPMTQKKSYQWFGTKTRPREIKIKKPIILGLIAFYIMMNLVNSL
jgi:hypothetical protein